jgi:hypothetical protein
VTDTAILVRTHYVDDEVLRLISSLADSSRHPVYALVDESRGPIPFGTTPKIVLGPQTVGELGLYDQCQKPYWRCGDYGLYAARRALPEIKRFWMVEPDVRIRMDRPGVFFDRFDADPSDLIVSWFGPADTTWDWGRTMDDGAPVWRCLFSLLRIGADAIDAMLGARQQMSARFVADACDPQFWPNDEVFTATTLMRKGFACRDLNALGAVYDPQTFGYWWPLSDRQVREQGQEGAVYHPVLNGDRYFQKLFHLACRLGDFSALEGAIEALTGLEWDEAQAVTYRRASALARSYAT